MAFRSAFLLFFLTAVIPVKAEFSSLWGENGERWNSRKRLPDFSFAGYRNGEKPIPETPVSANIKDFGARGDGRADDSAAFLAALESAKAGAILIPTGTYKISKQLKVLRRGIVLQGEGVGQTKLLFPKPLESVVGSGKKHAPAGSWSWSGGFISFEGTNNGQFLAYIATSAARGTKTFEVTNAQNLYVGQRVRLVQTNSDGLLGNHLYADQRTGSALLFGKKLIDFSCVIVSINKNKVSINRPVRTDVRMEWGPAFHSDAPTVEDVGVENLSIVFPRKRYAGHHDEPGYNAISFQGVSNGWVKNVEIINCDSAVTMRSSVKFCTIQGVDVIAQWRRASKGWEGHHAFQVGDMSQDNLIRDFQIKAKFIHSISLTSMAAGNVFMKGSGDDLCFDHHRKAPHENLFTEIDAGKGTDLWASGGDEDAGPFSGARETFWNIKTTHPQPLPEWATQINFIGVTTTLTPDLNPKENWLEPIPPEKLTPTNLYESQLKHRTSP